MAQDLITAANKLPLPTVHHVRSVLVVLDAEVAHLFGVETERLNEQIKRNEARFGDDFAFRLTRDEWHGLIPQNAGSKGRGGRRKEPYALTEHGVVMAATVLKSPQAATASRMIVQGFIEARRTMLAVGEGRNLPAAIDARALLPVSGSERQGMMAKLNEAIGRALDAIADPRANTTVRDELHAIAAEGIGAAKAWLAKGGIQNQKTLAEVHKLIAEAEALGVQTVGKHIENEHRRLALLAKQLRLALEMQRYLQEGTVNSLLATLRELEGKG